MLEINDNNKTILMRIMKKVAALLGVLILAGGVAFAQTPEEVTLKFNEAAELYNQKKYAEAIPVLESVVKMGLEVPEAIETVQEAQKLIPDAYFRKGLAAASAQNFDAALADFNKAAQLAELYGNASVQGNAMAMATKVYMITGGNAFNSGDYAKAIEIFSKGYEKDPNNTEMALLLAQSYAKAGNLDKSTEIYLYIISLETTHSKYAKAAAQAKEELTTEMLDAGSKAATAKELDEVIKWTDVILSYDPTNAPANMLRLQAANNAKNYDAVIRFGEAAAEAQTTPENKSNAYFLLGAAYQNKENKAKAVEMFRKVTAGPNVNTAKQQISALQ